MAATRSRMKAHPQGGVLEGSVDLRDHASRYGRAETVLAVLGNHSGRQVLRHQAGGDGLQSAAPTSGKDSFRADEGARPTARRNIYDEDIERWSIRKSHRASPDRIKLGVADVIAGLPRSASRHHES